MGVLSGKVVLITGGAHRVGKSIALALAREGADIAITYHSSGTEAQRTIDEIGALGVKAASFKCDQAEVRQIKATVQAVVERFERLDGLVNSASIMQEIPFMEITQENWDAAFDVNARGPFFFSQAAAAVMQAGTGGSIVNVLDESAVVPTKYFTHHSSSKAALRMLTLSTALALAPTMRVNAVLPGPVLMPEGYDPEKWQRLEKGIPLKRFGTPEDVARAVLFLMTEDYITGQILTIDGGRTIR